MSTGLCDKQIDFSRRLIIYLCLSARSCESEHDGEDEMHRPCLAKEPSMGSSDAATRQEHTLLGSGIAQ